MDIKKLTVTTEFNDGVERTFVLDEVYETSFDQEIAEATGAKDTFRRYVLTGVVELRIRGRIVK